MSVHSTCASDISDMKDKLWCLKWSNSIIWTLNILFQRVMEKIWFRMIDVIFIHAVPFYREKSNSRYYPSAIVADKRLTIRITDYRVHVGMQAYRLMKISVPQHNSFNYSIHRLLNTASILSQSSFNTGDSGIPNSISTDLSLFCSLLLMEFKICEHSESIHRTVRRLCFMS